MAASHRLFVFFLNKIIIKDNVKELCDEHDGNLFLLYSPHSLTLYCFLTHICLLIKENLLV